MATAEEETRQQGVGHAGAAGCYAWKARRSNGSRRESGQNYIRPQSFRAPLWRRQSPRAAPGAHVGSDSRKRSAALLETIPTVEKRQEIEDQMQYDWTVRVQNLAQLGRPATAMRHEPLQATHEAWNALGAAAVTNAELAKVGYRQVQGSASKIVGMNNAMSVTSVFPETNHRNSK